PGAHLSAHRGAYKGLVRAHLGLIVPEPREQCRMQVGNETVGWEEGKCVLFDDTYRHEVWNETEGTRVVLLIDVPRPFPPALAVANRAILRLFRLTPFVTGAVKRLRTWERDFYKTHPHQGRPTSARYPEGGISPSGKNTPRDHTPSIRRQPTHSGTASATSS
ncbi:MAG: aspartyl/asparaginyl beta-hydroxylase domain-containing protein, partial [Acetobacteraceae bacterium]|nr:aspartyl/asparaginyl beta-hydroxylase domain-containing protein [Acetobacteraceae bacterium]